MADRQSALKPARERRGIDYGSALTGCREMEALVLIASGLIAEMSVDGFDHTSRIALNLLRIRACLDTLEVELDRSPVIINQDGEYA